MTRTGECANHRLVVRLLLTGGCLPQILDLFKGFKIEDPSGCLGETSIFTARRVCIARTTMPWQDVRPSVRPSVRHTSVLCLNDYTYPQSFSASGSPTILVFPHQTGWQYSDEDPLTGASNARGYGKSRFSTNISLYLANDAR